MRYTRPLDLGWPSAPTTQFRIDQVTRDVSPDVLDFIRSLLCRERRWVGERAGGILRAPKAEVRSTAAWVGNRPIGVLVRRHHEQDSVRTEAGLFLVANEYRDQDIGTVLFCTAILQEHQLNRRIFAIVNGRQLSMIAYLHRFGSQSVPRWENLRLARGEEIELTYPRAAIIAAQTLLELEATGRFNIAHPLLRRAESRAWVESLANLEI